MSDSDPCDPDYLPILKIPCVIIRNPAYFTKYLPSAEKDRRRKRKAQNTPKVQQLPTVTGRGYKTCEDIRPITFRYETAYGGAYIRKKLSENHLDIREVKDKISRLIPSTPVDSQQADYFNYQRKKGPIVRRTYNLWEPKKEVKYFKNEIDKRLIEAKQRINKRWKKDLKDYFHKEKKTEGVILRRVETLERGLKAYLKNVDKDIRKYEKDGNKALLKIQGMKCKEKKDKNVPQKVDWQQYKRSSCRKDVLPTLELQSNSESDFSSRSG